MLYKHDHNGNYQWHQVFGTSMDDFVWDVATDSAGNIFVSGDTQGSLGGPFVGGFTDAFLAKFNSSGTMLWARQYGTNAGASTGLGDQGHGVATDSQGNVYLAGIQESPLFLGTTDAFLAKYDTNGNLLWNHTVPTVGQNWYEEGWAVSTDSLGGVYLTGNTRADLAGPNAGFQDAFLAKYDQSGNLQWTRQWGTAGPDYAEGVSADGLGHVYVSGYTYPGPTGFPDAWVTKYDDQGNQMWTRLLATPSGDLAYNVAADGPHTVYAVGVTNGSLGGPNLGDDDAWVARLSPTIPEPSTFAALAITAIVVTLGRRR